MYTSTIIAVVIVWTSVVAMIVIGHHIRRRLALALLVEVWYILEEMRTTEELDTLWVNKHRTLYDALLNLADDVHPSVGIEFMQYVEFSDYLHNNEETTNHDQA